MVNMKYARPHCVGARVAWDGNTCVGHPGRFTIFSTNSSLRLLVAHVTMLENFVRQVKVRCIGPAT